MCIRQYNKPRKQSKTRKKKNGNQNLTERTDESKRAGSFLPRESHFSKNKNEPKECQQTNTEETTLKADADVCGAGSLRRRPLVGLLPWYPVCHLLPALIGRGFPAAVIPPFTTPLGTARRGSVAIAAQCRHNLVPLCHEAFGCEDPFLFAVEYHHKTTKLMSIQILKPNPYRPSRTKKNPFRPLHWDPVKFDPLHKRQVNFDPINDVKSISIPL